MSAAEKLRALDAARGEFAWEESLQKFDLFNALPQIMAVVVLAEGIAETDAPVWGTRDGLGFKLQNALAALDEQLGDLGSPPTSERSTAL